MSLNASTCTYHASKHDPSNWHGNEPEEWTLEEDTWDCYHNPLPDSDHEKCIFHDPDHRAGADAFISAIKESASEDDPEIAARKREFIGATFGRFELEKGTTIGGDFEHPIRLDNVMFEDGITAKQVYFHEDIYFQSSRFRGSVSFMGAEFNSDGNVWFRGAKFIGDGNVTFGDAKFECEGDVSFRAAEFDCDGYVEFSDTDFSVGGEVVFTGTKFIGEDHIFFRGSKFTSNEPVAFLRTKFAVGGDVNFSTSVFSGDRRVSFRAAEFECDGDVCFWGAEFLGDGDVSFQGTNFKCGGEILFGASELFGQSETIGAEFKRSVDFTTGDLEGEDTIIQGESVSFEGCTFHDDVTFTNRGLKSANFKGADLTDATFANSDLRETNFESALLSRATLFGADLRGAKLSGALLGDARVDENTMFLGHHEEAPPQSNHTLKAVFGKPRCSYDPNYGKGPGFISSQIIELFDPESGEDSSFTYMSRSESEEISDRDNLERDHQTKRDQAKSVYRMLEEIGQKAARHRLQTRAFVRRQDIEKHEYKRTMLNRDLNTSNSKFERIIAGLRFSRAWISKKLLLYGESPWRIITGAVLIILSFAIIYPFGEWLYPVAPDGGLNEAVTYREYGVRGALERSVYFSMLTFTTLGFGDFKPVGVGEWLAMTNAGLGAVLIAMLVFVLGRRAVK